MLCYKRIYQSIKGTFFGLECLCCMMKATKFSQYLQGREELKFADNPHWIYLVEAAIWASVIALAGLFAHNFLVSNFIQPILNDNVRADGFFVNIAGYLAIGVFWGSILIGIGYFLNQLIFWASTFVFASDRRLYLKTGLIHVVVNEVSFEEIRKTDINYGWIGRFLGYGKLLMDARFVEDTALPFIYHPEQFSKLIHYGNDLASDINLSYATNGMTDHADNIIPQQTEKEDQVPPMHEQAEFVDMAFTDAEKDEIHPGKEKHDNPDILDEFDVVSNTPQKSVVKPAHTDNPKPIRA